MIDVQERSRAVFQVCPACTGRLWKAERAVTPERTRRWRSAAHALMMPEVHRQALGPLSLSVSQVFAVKTRWRWKHRRWSQTWFGSVGLKLYQLSYGLDLISHILCILIEIPFVWVSYFCLFIQLFMLSFFLLLFLFYSSCSPCMKCKVLFIIIRSIIFGLWMLCNKAGSRLWFQRNRQVFQSQSEFWRLTCFRWLFIRDNLIHVKLATGSQCAWMNGQWAACVLEMEEINLKALIHCRPAATFTLTQTDSYLHWSLFSPFFHGAAAQTSAPRQNETNNFMGWFLRGENDLHWR